MRRVYENASCVIVWLEEAPENIELVELAATAWGSPQIGWEIGSVMMN
jgi:hypothetical protein